MDDNKEIRDELDQHAEVIEDMLGDEDISDVSDDVIERVKDAIDDIDLAEQDSDGEDIDDISGYTGSTEELEVDEEDYVELQLLSDDVDDDNEIDPDAPHANIPDAVVEAVSEAYCQEQLRSFYEEEESLSEGQIASFFN